VTSDSSPAPRAIGGRLGRTLALRSTAPVDEAAIVIEHREPLIYMLCAAAELEHALMWADVGVGIMFDVIEPLADILTTLPVRPEHPGRTAGATFEVFSQPDYLLPHGRAAWLLMAEHLSDAADLAGGESARDARFVPVADALRAHADAVKAQAN
jgi:hypothetical protein